MTTTSDLTASRAAQPQSYRLLYVSVRGHRCLLGGPTIDADSEIPADIGTLFASFDEIERHVRHDLRGLSVYWQVQVVDERGSIVRLGFRSGHNGTGNRWEWRSASL